MSKTPYSIRKVIPGIRNAIKLGYCVFFQVMVVLLWTLFLASCAQYERPEDVEGPVFIEVSPHEIVASGGSTQDIWVTVLDVERRPVPGVLVRAESDTPARVVVVPESLLTNAEGRAVFSANGISRFPGAAYITFVADGLSAQVETDFLVW